MGSSIQPLSAELVYRIAAGEVIDSLGAVVRELVDNALDAAATRIQVSLWPQQGRVQVADNGSGLAWADLRQAALPHTTSKITAFQQLGALRTLGFRGEALHSLAQLGQLEICSRTHESLIGWRAAYGTQGDMVQAEEIAMAVGTTVTVAHLFQNWPSRQEGFAKPSPILQSIQTMIGDYALCHPQVTWQVAKADRSWFNLAPSNSPKETLLQLVRKLSADNLRHHSVQITLNPQTIHPKKITTQPSSLEEPIESIQGRLDLLVGLPDQYHRPRSDWVRIAVNGRRVYVNTESSSDPWVLGPLEQTILNAFRQTLPRHRYPLCWVHLQVPSALVDWNRTASKSHIYLHQIEGWREQITQHIHQALHFSDSATLESFSLRQFLKSAERQGQYTISPTSINLSSPLPSASLPEASNSIIEGTLRAIAQLHQTYILAEHPTGLWLVEQHIAHERILYEQLCQHWQLVPLHSPLILKNLSDQQVQNLDHLGLTIDLFGQTLWAVRTAPQCLAQRPDCLDALYELSHCSATQPALAATACRSAIRNGQPLSLSKMQTILDQWQQTQNPRTCPHGRPIYLRLEEQALSRFFRRHWVIGKSHGL